MTGNLFQFLIKWILIGLIGLILFGALPGTELVIIVGLFVAVRVFSLVAEARREEVTERRELFAEFLGIAGFAVLVPLSIALFANDFFSFRTSQGWIGVLVVVAGIGFYAAPHFFRAAFFESSLSRRVWWAAPFAPALLFVLIGIADKHPYLNPLHPEQTKLAAHRVLALENNVIAGNHADWVLRYAEQLDRQGDRSQAIHYYEQTLRLDAELDTVRSRLAALGADGSGASSMQSPAHLSTGDGPYWTDDGLLMETPRRRIDSQLEQVGECTVVVVAIGEVPDSIMDTTAHTIRHVLNLAVVISEETIPLPRHTRVRGLLTGRQWHAMSLVEALLAAHEPFPQAPIKYVILTPADIYGDGTNYIFSGSFNWGGVVSFARYGDPANPDHRLLHRTAKQTLCALLKSFEVPISSNRACVTSYTRSLPEFDRKGDRPDFASMTIFRENLNEINRGWRRHKQARDSAGVR